MLQSPVILHLCLSETRPWGNVSVFEKQRFQNVFRPHENEKLICVA